MDGDPHSCKITINYQVLGGQSRAARSQDACTWRSVTSLAQMRTPSARQKRANGRADDRYDVSSDASQAQVLTPPNYVM